MAIDLENFKNFLKENKAYTAFCVNLGNQKSMSFEELGSVGDYRSIIDNSLTWAHTEECSDYWYDIDQKWRKACDDGIKFNNRCKSIW